MFETQLDRLRKKLWLSPLPNEIEVPPLGDREVLIKPIGEASVDDVAFAIQGLNRKMSALSAQLDALRTLHDMARRAGAIGADAAIEAAMRSLEDA